MLISFFFFNMMFSNTFLASANRLSQKLLVTQAINGHHAFVRRVAMMDQFCTGLNTLGVLQEIRNLPSEFQKLFVPSLDFRQSHLKFSKI